MSKARTTNVWYLKKSMNVPENSFGCTDWTRETPAKHFNERNYTIIKQTYIM